MIVLFGLGVAESLVGLGCALRERNGPAAQAWFCAACGWASAVILEIVSHP